MFGRSSIQIPAYAWYVCRKQNKPCLDSTARRTSSFSKSKSKI